MILAPGTVLISVTFYAGQRCRPFTHKNCEFKRGINPQYS
nr:MAG TPA: hypothetical protein [Caudoviricetes sp.]